MSSKGGISLEEIKNESVDLVCTLFFLFFTLFLFAFVFGC
jgi:hypothetical protein